MINTQFLVHSSQIIKLEVYLMSERGFGFSSVMNLSCFCSGFDSYRYYKDLQMYLSKDKRRSIASFYLSWLLQNLCF